MKIQYKTEDKDIIKRFLDQWIPSKPNKQEKAFMSVLFFDECEPIDFDCDAVELNNCIIELHKEGFKQSVKRIFQGDHFYRSDTGKCLRCLRYRPEIHWNNENIKDYTAQLCDRCEDNMKWLAKDKVDDVCEDV